MEELSKKVKKLNQNQDVLDVIIENEDELIRNTLYENAVRKGISQGIEQKAEETVKKMLEEKLDINLISKITGLAKGEIIKLKEG